MAHHSSTRGKERARHIVDAEAGELSVETHVSVTQVRRHFLVQAAFIIEHAQVTCTIVSIRGPHLPSGSKRPRPHPELKNLYQCQE